MLSGLAAGSSLGQVKSAEGATSPGVVGQKAASGFAGDVAYVYVNARTGERTVTHARPNSRGFYPPIWINEDTASNGDAWFALDDYDTDPMNPVFGEEAKDWGDIEFDSLVDGYTAAYVSNVGPAAGPPNTAVPGYTLINWWYDNDNGFGDISSVPVWGVGVSSIPGGDGSGGFAGWVLTLDLAGASIPFELGDTDGSFTGVSGSMTGNDKDDTDGCPKNDFAWSYAFDQSGLAPADQGVCGPFLVLPASADIAEDDAFPTGATGNADGVDDAFDLYDNTGVYVGTFNFGGWVPMGATPYASLFMGLYGQIGPDCCVADYNGDTVIDIQDQLDFFDDYGTCENMPAPCGSFGNPDINGDTTVDFVDQLDFLDVYGQCTD